MIKINYNKFNINININLTTKTLNDNVSNIDMIRYIKGILTNKDRFISRFVNVILDVEDKLKEHLDEKELKSINIKEFMNELLSIYDNVKPFTYIEAFKIENDAFRSLVFGSINISEMIEELGHERIKTEGKRVKHKQFDKEGNFLGYKEYDVIYEVHKINGQKLRIEDCYALKMWCTSTNKEHWLWINDDHKDSPLEAISSTFMVHKNIIPYIKELKRQGDILLVELTKEIKPEGELIPLTAEQYFRLLTAQS